MTPATSRAGNRPEQDQTIGVLNESSLHAALKEWCALPGDAFEVNVGQFVVDIVRGDTLIEIQTSHFGSIRDTLRKLAQDHQVLVVYPLAQEKYLVYIDSATDEVVRCRKSPKKGQMTDLFDELVRVPTLIWEKNLSLQVVLTREEELRHADEKIRGRRRRAKVIDRKLIEVLGQAQFHEARDFLKLLPEGMERPFTNQTLARRMGISIHIARKMTYSLRKLKLVAQVGKEGRSFLFDTIPDIPVNRTERTRNDGS